MKRTHNGFVIMLAAYGICFTSCPALALIDCTSPINYGSFTANDDYHSTGGSSCIVLVGGGTLNLNGRTITCDSGYTCGTAITVQNSSTAATVKNATILGGFQVAIDASASVTKLTTIQANTIRLSSLWPILVQQYGINGGQKILQNVIKSQYPYPGHGDGMTAISWFPSNITGAVYQYVQDNFVDCPGPSTGIYVGSQYTGTGLPAIKTNFVKAGNYLIFAYYSGSNFQVLNNIFASYDTGGGNVLPFGGIVPSSGNTCDQGASQNSLGIFCEGPGAPYNLP